MKRNNKIFSIVVIIFTFLFVFLTDAYCQDWSSVDERAKALTVHIGTTKSSINDTIRTKGTGVIIGQDLVVSCSHIFHEGIPFVKYNDIYYQATIVDSVSGGNGLCLLQVPGVYLSGNPARFATPNLEQLVLLKGNIWGWTNYTAKAEIIGYVESIPRLNYVNWLIKIKGGYGMSGGGVWNIDGQLVGIIWGQILDEYTCFINAKIVSNLLFKYRTKKENFEMMKNLEGSF